MSYYRQVDDKYSFQSKNTTTHIRWTWRHKRVHNVVSVGDAGRRLVPCHQQTWREQQGRQGEREEPCQIDRDRCKEEEEGEREERPRRRERVRREEKGERGRSQGRKERSTSDFIWQHWLYHTLCILKPFLRQTTSLLRPQTPPMAPPLPLVPTSLIDMQTVLPLLVLRASRLPVQYKRSNIIFYYTV